MFNFWVSYLLVKDSEIKESIEKPKEIKNPEEDKNTTDPYPNWFDTNTQSLKTFQLLLTGTSLITGIK